MNQGGAAGKITLSVSPLTTGPYTHHFSFPFPKRHTMKLTLRLLLALLLVGNFGLLAQAPLESIADLPVDPPKEEQEAADNFSFSGYVDAYYQYNFIETSNSEEPIPFPTSFTGQTNQFAIGNVNFLAEKTLGKVSFVGQVGFGPRAIAGNSDSNSEFIDAGDNFASTIQQLYVTYSPSDAVTFTLGNFGTFVGYEVIDAPANVNYSTSYLFSNGPFYHTGAKVDFALGEGFGAMVGVFNDTDSKIDVISGKHIGGQLSAEVGGLAAYLNVLTGKEVEGPNDDETDDDLYEFQVDLTATYEVNETVSLGLNASSYGTSVDGNGRGGFFGTALYGTFGFSEDFDLGLRAEYFTNRAAEDDDDDQASVLAITASGNFTVGDLRIIPEVRFDAGNDEFLVGDDLDDTSIASFILAAVYSF